MKGKDRKPHIFWLEGLPTKFNAPFPYDDADDPRRLGFVVGQQPRWLVPRGGPRNLDSGFSEISIVFQAAVPKPVVPKYTTSGVRRPSER